MQASQTTVQLPARQVARLLLHLHTKAEQCDADVVKLLGLAQALAGEDTTGSAHWPWTIEHEQELRAMVS